jgi:hypothetical protein
VNENQQQNLSMSVLTSLNQSQGSLVAFLSSVTGPSKSLLKSNHGILRLRKR